MDFIYIGDPLCSWCYGIGPAVDRIREKHPRFGLKLVMGGLRPYTESPMDSSMKEMLRGHWKHVEEATQQPFNYDLLQEESEDFVYNTERPCRAVATVRKIKPGSEWTFFKDVQDAFYHKNQDTNQLETYFTLLEKLDIDPEVFTTEFNSETMRKDTNDDFMWAKQVGVTGFPTLLLGNNSELHAISMGYSPFETIEEVMEKILNEGIGS